MAERADFTTHCADDARPCPWWMHVTSLSLVGVLPTLFCYLYAPWPRAAALAVVLSLAVPRAFAERVPPKAGDALVALYWNLVYLFSFPSPALLVACLWRAPALGIPPLLAYALWNAATRPEMTGHGRPWMLWAEREWGLQSMRRFMDLKLHVSAALAARPLEKTVVIAVHPHGVACDYRAPMDGLLHGALAGRKVRNLAASVLFMIPICREVCLWTGCVDARRSVADKVLRQGNSVLVMPGGELEQIKTRAHKEEVHLKNRSGFVRLAIRHGAALVPAYAFGTVDLYETYTFLGGVREAIRKNLGVCVPLYKGSFGALPKRTPVNVVLGAPLEVGQKDEPSAEDVATAHEAYMAALKALFDQHKAAYGVADRELSIL